MSLSRRTLALLLMMATLSARPTGGDSQPSRKYWIYFSDKQSITDQSIALTPGSTLYNHAAENLSPRALARRAKVMPAASLVTAADLPIDPSYIDAVRRAGGTIVQQSKWMNAVSALLNNDGLQAVKALPFVAHIEPVRSFPKIQREQTVGLVPPQRSTASFDYGNSLLQLQLVDIPPLHDLGVTGKGVLIGMLDSGFRWRVHEALSTRTVVGEYDFIFHDSVTANEAVDDPAQDEHGTLTMSIVGGYKPGTLIGAAFDASFILGKTEDIRSETRVEEDNWAAGIEWMEGRGVDVVSSSLGYNIFDDGTGYTWANGDFNGRTSVTARAAVRAAELGVVVCNAMGNESNGDGVTGTMLTPADADSILSVGAIDMSRSLEPFSSTGPTNDARTKPDLVAPGGRGMVVAIPPNNYSIGFQGTSLATPLVAGAAALLLSARPELTPIQVRDALRNAADSVDAQRFPVRPNNFTGWGLTDAFRAALSFGPILSNEPSVSIAGTGNAIDIDVCSSAGIRPDSVILHYAPGRSNEFSTVAMTLDSAMIYPTSGRYRAVLPPLPADTLVRFYVDAADSGGGRYRSPAPITGKTWELRYGKPGAHISPDIPAGYALYQNYPNPFNGWTTIEFDLPRDEFVSIDLYDVRGAHLATLLRGSLEAGARQVVRLNASRFASGVYFYNYRTPSVSLTRKLLILR